MYVLGVPVLGVCCHVSTADWLTSLPAHVTIGRRNYFGFGFTPLHFLSLSYGISFKYNHLAVQLTKYTMNTTIPTKY